MKLEFSGKTPANIHSLLYLLRVNQRHDTLSPHRRSSSSGSYPSACSRHLSSRSRWGRVREIRRSSFARADQEWYRTQCRPTPDAGSRLARNFVHCSGERSSFDTWCAAQPRSAGRLDTAGAQCAAFDESLEKKRRHTPLSASKCGDRRGLWRKWPSYALDLPSLDSPQ